MTTKELGNLGEKLACEYLVEKGFVILGRNWEINWGEIDIIARKKSPFWRFFSRAPRPIHFVEVKALKSQANLHPKLIQGWFPEQHADYHKQRKIKQLAEIWLKKQRYPQDFPYQIDIIGVLINEETRYSDIEYFPNAVKG